MLKAVPRACIICKEGEAEVRVINTYTGWFQDFCKPCAHFYIAFQDNYIQLPLTEGNNTPNPQLNIAPRVRQEIEQILEEQSF